MHRFITLLHVLSTTLLFWIGEAAECTDAEAASADSIWATAAATAACKPYVRTTNPVYVYAPCTATDCVKVMEGVAKKLPNCTFSGINNKIEVENALTACNGEDTHDVGSITVGTEGSIVTDSSGQVGFSNVSSSPGSASTEGSKFENSSSQFGLNSSSSSSNGSIWASSLRCTKDEVKDMWHQYVLTAQNAACGQDVSGTSVGISTTCSSNCADLIKNMTDNLPNCWYDYWGTNQKKELYDEVHHCDGSIFAYMSMDPAILDEINGTDSSKSSSSIGIIIGIAAGGMIFVLVVGILLWRYRRSTNKQKLEAIQTPGDANESTMEYIFALLETQKSGTASTTPPISDGVLPSKRWDDESIIAARIPRENVIIERLINRGGFGEVYVGSYNGKRVAIKMLSNERKKNLRQVDAFLSEVKLMSTLDHPCIVEFIGVAWNSLNDLCIVTEFMTIDLKAILSKFARRQLPLGFNHDKVKVALHVAHSLTYLHSCAPPVIHRDLKSSNILLNEQMDAKVTDFGISRERIDATMTAGVGTSLWMAPEVMLGERYDDKADMFSFGVVLSEIDQHALPYWHAKSNGNSGQRLTDAAILQMVAAGKLRVEFSQAAPESMVELAHACVSMDPKQRPTAAEALYRLQTIISREM